MINNLKTALSYEFNLKRFKLNFNLYKYALIITF